VNLPEFGIHGGGDASGGILALLDQFLAKLTSGGAGLADGFELFPGIAVLGWNVHPLLVHFPIALLSCFFLLDVCGVAARSHPLRAAARWLLYLGALGAVAAAAAGWIAAQRVPHGAVVHEIMEWHGRLGITVAGLASILALWRAVAQERLALMATSMQLLLAAVLVVAMSFGADLGGLMVYGYGVGVRQLEAGGDHHHGAP